MDTRMQQSPSFSQFFLQYQGRYYPLNKAQIIIGSDQSCDIRIENNPRVLPRHAQVILQTGQVFLRCMERSAAIWVNGAPVAEKMLQNRDEIAVGDPDTRLTLLLNENAAGVDQAATWVNPARQAGARALHSGPTTGPQAAQNAGGMQGLSAPQPLPPAWSAASPRQTPPTMAATPPLGAAPTFSASQPPGALAAMSQSQAPMPAMAGKATDTTRYLCAAGHLDEGFQDYVMRYVIYEERRARGESYGVDMPAVVSWCKSGLQRINARDWFLTILLALAVFGYFLTTIVVNSLIANTYQSLGLASLLLRVVQFFSGGSTILSLIILPIAFNFEKWLRRRWHNYLSGLITYPVLLVLFGPVVVLVWLTIFVERLVGYYGEPTKRLRKDTFNPQARPVPLDYNLERKLQENFVTGQRNVVAYSGDEPFAGAGYYRGGWSLVIDTSKGAYDPSDSTSSAKRLKPLPFTVSSFYDAVEKDVRALGINNVLEIEGKLYVHGQYLPEKPQFFNVAAIRPVTSIDPRLVEQYKENPTEDVRYYQCLRFNFWRGEMIFTAFLRFVQRGKELFIEINYVLLPPMEGKYYWVDEKEITPSINTIWQLYKRSFDAPVQTWLGAPFRLLRGFFYTTEQSRLARVALNHPAFDYGAPTSLRQYASDNKHHLFFQALDEEMYFKVIEKQILETIFNFLKAHQIDTTELRQREQAILNSNTTFNGPTTIGAQAIGTGAQANNTPAPTSQSGQPR